MGAKASKPCPGGQKCNTGMCVSAIISQPSLASLASLALLIVINLQTSKLLQNINFFCNGPKP